MKNIIFKNINKTYKKRTKKAVDNLSFEIEKGEIVGLLGPNGSGKSTTVKILCGIIKPDEGEVSIQGIDVFEDRKKIIKRIGIMFGAKSTLIYHLPIIDSLGLTKKLYKVDDESYRKNLDKYSEILGMKDILDQRVATLSLGQKVKAELLNILIFDPDILILDEPTIGLDIIAKRSLRTILDDLGNHGKSILITTHDVNDVIKIASRIIIINEGVKSFDLKADEFKRMIEKFKKFVIYDCENVDELIIEGVELITSKESYNEFLVANEQYENFLNLIGKKYNFSVQTPSLEDLLYEYY